MVWHALSASAKKRESQHIAKSQLEDVVKAYNAKQLKDLSQREGLRKIAKKFNLSHTTLLRHVKGTDYIADFNRNKQKLTPAEEYVMVRHALECASRGFPLSHNSLTMMANAILDAQQQ